MKYLIVSDIHGSLPALEKCWLSTANNSVTCSAFWAIS